MQIFSKAGYATLALSALVAFSPVDTVHAQTVNMTAAAVVDNTLTIAEVSPLNFGDIVALGDDTNSNDATVTVDTDGNLSAGGANGLALTAIVDDAAASRASLTVEDGANNATINVTVDNVVAPTFGGESFDVGGWQASYNGGGDVSLTPGTSQPFTFSAAFGTGTNTLDIGATLTTNQDGAYPDGTYNGNFDVIFSY